MKAKRVRLEAEGAAFVLEVEDAAGAVHRFTLDEEQLDLLADEIDDALTDD